MGGTSKSQAREDAVLRRLLKTPPAPRGKPKPKTSKSPAEKQPPKA